MHTSHLHEFYIGGKWVKPSSDARLSVENPATEAEIATIAAGNAEDINRAVEAAATALKTFRFTTPDERRALLLRILEVFEKRSDEISIAIGYELGSPHDLAFGTHVATTRGHLGAFASAIEEMDYDFRLPNGNRILRQPIGVAGLITPWNWPIHQVSLKLFAAIAAGCTTVLKPSEVTPLSALVMAEILDEAGVPAGVFNLVNGTGIEAGAALSAHPKVAFMSFTGSTIGGRAVAKTAADTTKKVALELGGKSACLIFADANLPKAIGDTFTRTLGNSGQNCNAPTRLLVERSVYAEAIELAKQAANAQKVGRPEDKGNHIGPVANKRQWEHIQTLIGSAIAQGATLVAGGLGKPEGLEQGYYVKPTFFADVTPDMDIYKQEVFGPVLIMSAFDTEEEAVQLANDSEYGLAAFIHTSDDDKLERLTQALEAGMVFGNSVYNVFGSPFGGVKGSGYGREGGIFGIEEFQNIKLCS